jgi:sialic acid synthase SpsE
MKIGKRVIGGDSPCFIIAEAGTSHLGNSETGYRLIDAAQKAGADCVKFQLIYVDEIIHPRTGSVELPGGKVDLYTMFKNLEKDLAFYHDLKAYTERAGLIFLCTPFGLKSARILNDLGVKVFKIASAELNHFPLLEEIAGYRLPVILSTGISQLRDIEAALAITGSDTALLHCITAYPAPEEEYNLRLLPNLSGIFGMPVGISDHSVDPVLVPALGVAMGASIIEKHITLSREGRGLDDPIALTPSEFSRMVDAIRGAVDMGKEQTITWLKQTYGGERVAAILGSGTKHLAPSERDNYHTTRRSIHALTDISSGDLFSPDNAALLRTEKNLRPGIEPEYLSLVLGLRSKRNIRAGEGITWGDIL